MVTALQNNWNTELEKARNNQANFRDTEAPAPKTPAPEKPAVTKSNPIQIATLQLARTLLTSGIATFGFTWVLLFFYTLIKDLAQFSFLADPGDAMMLFTPAQATAQIPESAKSMSRLASRLFIYPVGGLILSLYLMVPVIIIIMIQAFLKPSG